MDWLLLGGILVGSLATISMNVGKGIQKMKVHVLVKRSAVFQAENRRDFLIWLSGVGLTASSAALFSVALKMTDKSSIVSSLAGVGLVALIIFSHSVLREKIGFLEISGGFLIITGTILVGLFDVNLSGRQVYSSSGLFLSLAIIFSFFAVLIPYSLKTKRLHGFVFGALVGTLIGLGIILADIALVKVEDSLLRQFTTPYPYLALFFAVSALAVTQFAFLRGRAIEVVPCINSFLILTPIFLEYFTFHTLLLPAQYIGILVIVVGVVILSSAKERVMG